MSDAPSEFHAKGHATSSRAVRSEVADEAAKEDSRRLRQLLESLRPILARLPLRSDAFEVTFDDGGNPRLRLDTSWFVNMVHDGRAYRLQYEDRSGCGVLAESASLDGAIDATVACMARCVVEGERGLKPGTIPFHPAIAAGDSPTAKPTGMVAPENRTASSAGPLYWLGQVFWFVVEVFGLLVLFGMVWIGLQAWVPGLLR